MGTKQMKIAVIGSGISGLAAAWYLGKDHHVTLCERGPNIGMDAHSVEIESAQGNVYLNAPMRVFFEGYYPTLTQLYRDIGIAFEPVKYSGSFSQLNGDSFFHYRNHWLGALTLPFLTGRSLFSRQAWQIAFELLRFLRLAKRNKNAADRSADTITLDNYLKQHGFSALFAERFLYPAFAGICTCSYDSLKNYPASMVLEYLDSDLTWSRVNRLSHGARDVAQRLSAGATEVRCNFNLTRLTPTDQGVEITNCQGETEVYDHVIVATQANQARSLLESQSTEAKILERFQYEKSRLIIHTDEALAPSNKKDWAPVNFLLSDQHDKPMASIWMNQIYPQLNTHQPIFETWNPFQNVAADKILIDAQVERPVVSEDSLRAIQALEQIHQQPDRRIWFCGSYAHRGIPLLESAVASAKNIAERLS